MSGALSFLEQNKLLDDNEKEKTQSSSATSYIPSQQAIDETAQADFTTGQELIEGPIKRGGEVPQEDLLAMRFSPPMASFGAFPFLLAVPRPYQDKKMDKDRFRENRVKNLAKEQGGTYEYSNMEVSDKLGFEGQALLGFADNINQVSNAIEKVVGPGNFKIFEDKNANFLQDRYYVSVKRDDGTFSPFTSPTQSTFDYVQKFLPMGAYEITTDAAAVGTSLLTMGVVSSLTGPAAPITGPLALGYSLYVFNKAGERGRQLLQKNLGLTKGEADDFGTFVEEIQKLVADPKAAAAITKLFGGEADITSNEFKQELRGIVGTAFPFIPGLLDKVTLAMSRVRDKLAVDKGELFESAIKAETFADNVPVLPGADKSLEKGLVSTMISQRTMDKKIGRVAALVDQTSGYLSKRVREQMTSLYKYMDAFKNNFGGGNFNKFRQDMSSMNKLINDVKDGKITVDPERLGTSIAEVENLFLALRMDESRGMYKAIFDALGERTINLEKIRARIVSREVKDIVPTSKQTAGAPVEASAAPLVPGEGKLNSIVEDLINLGVTSKNTRVLTQQGVEKAVAQFRNKYPEYAKYMDDNYITIKTPAELLHGYATLLGQLSSGTFSKDIGTASNAPLASFAKNLRDDLLDSLANPIVSKKFPKVEGIDKKLAEANAFYRETMTRIESPLQIEARVASKTGGETTTIPSALGLTETATAPTSRTNVTLSNIRFQEDYIAKNLNKTNFDKRNLGKLQQAFADVISFKLAGAGNASLTKIESAESVKAYIQSFTKRERLNLGLTPDAEKTLFKDLEILSKLNALDIPARYKLGSRIKNAELGEVFSSAIAKTDDIGFKQDIDTMLEIINKMPNTPAKKEALDNLGNGLIDFAISKQSGVIQEVTAKNAVFAQIGDLTINPTKLSEVIEKFKNAGVFDKILTKPITLKDGKQISMKEMLENFQNYAGVISQTGADAGSALSGAQLIGNLFTLNPKKFVEGITRISAQGRVAKLLTNKAFADAITGLAKPKATTAFGKMMERNKQYFLGKGAISNIIAQFALKGVQEYNRASEMSQTDMMLNNEYSGASSYLQQTQQPFQKEIGVQ